MKDLNASWEIEKNYEPTYFSRAISKYYLKDYHGGLEDCEKALSISDATSTHFWKGVNLIGLKKYKEALNEYDLVIERDPKYADAYYNRGLAYFDMGIYDKSIQDNTDCIAIDPLFPKAY